MKKFFPIILLLLTASFANSQSLQNSFNDVRDLSSYVSSEFSLIASEYTDLESTTVNEGGWAWRNYNDEKDSFTDLANISQDLSTFFTSLEIEFGSIANVFANFDGSYSSLSGLPSLFDGSFSSLSGTPTTLAGYGITDSGLKYVTEGGNTGVRLSSANAANHGDIGNTAVDLSYQSSASSTTGATGQSSFAVGLDSTASGAHSVSGGYASVASGDTSVALGNSAQATGTFSYSIGHSSEANGDNSVALGFFNKSDGQNATAIGRGNLATGETATATGQFTSASGKFSLSSGLYSNASGTTSVALGNNTIADGYGTLATGYFNTANANPQADSFDQSNTAFVIGNGTSQNRSNAFKVLFDGTTTIAGDLSINSDARLKANIVSLGATLSKLLQIDGKSYTIKKDKREKQKIGLLAQDIEKVFPELVSESNGIKSVNYQGLVPVLINALKEQEEKIKSQENKLLKLESLVQDLVDNQ
jgi:hypothetical protein